MQNGKLNTSQRQALVKLVKNEYNRRLEHQRRLCDDAVAQITNEVKCEMGIAQLDDELKSIQNRMNEIVQQKEKVGFSKYNDTVIYGSEAKRLIDKGVSAEREKISAIQSEMDRTISAIWTANELSEIKGMVDDILN